MSLRSLKCVALLAVWTLSLACGQGASARDDSTAANPNEAAIKQELAKALAHYKAGDYAKAAEALDRVLSMQPDSILAIRLRDQVGFAELFKMLHSKEMSALKPGARKLLDLAEKGVMRKKADVAAIKALVADLGGGLEKRWTAIYELQAIGDTAVPYLLECVTADKTPKYPKPAKILAARSAAIIALSRMHHMAVPPLIKALHCPDWSVRQTAAILLGEAKDFRAVPALKALWANAKQDERVKTAATKALATLTDKLPTALPPAEALYLDLAKAYLKGEYHAVGYMAEPKLPIWGFNPKGKTVAEQVVYRSVPAYAYNYEMAQNACFDGLAANPSYPDLATAILANYFTMRTRIQQLIGNQGKGPLGLQVLGYEEKDAKKRLASLNELDVIALVPGKDCLYKLLHSALGPKPRPQAEAKATRAEGDPELALAVIKALVQLGDDSAEQTANPLIDALKFWDTRVRYAAANALLAISPAGRMLPGDDERDAVISTVVAALAELTQPVVMVVDQDPEMRKRFKGMLADIGYNPISSPNATVCLERAQMPIPKVALILVADDLKGFKAEALAKFLKDSPASAHIPLLLLHSPQKGEKAMPKPDHFLGVVAKSVEAAPLKKMIADVLSKDKAAQADKEQATKIVVAALTTLQAVDPKTSAYKLDRLTPMLADLLLEQPDPVRLLAARVAANMGKRELMEPLLKVFANTKSPKDLRVAAADAIGRILIDAGDVFKPQECAALEAALADKDALIRKAASRALGRGAAIAPVTMAILRKHRIK